MRRTALTALVAVMVVLAGCGATSQGLTTTSQAGQPSDALQPSTGTASGPTGTLAFYVSDQPAAIEDFEHLNVTIEKVGLKPADVDDDEEEGEESDDSDAENETDDEETTTAMTTTAANDSTTTTTETNESTTTTTTETDEEPEQETEQETKREAEQETEREAEGDDAGWITYEVDNRTVDLTELKGANATRLANLSAPSGTYKTVFVYVSDIEGTLKNGEQVTVKLPSQKLQLHTTFELGPDATTNFVYDIAVHKAGGSGKYILKPNIGESGTDVAIEDIEKKGKTDGMDDDEDAEEMESDDDSHETTEADETDEEEMPEGEMDEGNDDASGLDVTILGNVTAGAEVAVEVTDTDGEGVPGATVRVNGHRAGVTDTDGQVTITVPDAETLEIEVKKGGAEGSEDFQIQADS